MVWRRTLRAVAAAVVCLALAGCPGGSSDGACAEDPPGASPLPCDDHRDVRVRPWR